MQIEAPEFRWSIVHAFNGDIGGIAGIAIFAVLFVWYFMYMKKSNAQMEEKNNTIILLKGCKKC